MYTVQDVIQAIQKGQSIEAISDLISPENVNAQNDSFDSSNSFDCYRKY
jgi:hypothetical protein